MLLSEVLTSCLSSLIIHVGLSAFHLATLEIMRCGRCEAGRKQNTIDRVREHTTVLGVVEGNGTSDITGYYPGVEIPPRQVGMWRC